MADVTLTYKGQKILELSASGNKAIKTAGKYCEGDINLAYEKDESIYNILKGSAQPTAGIGQDGDVYLQFATLDGEIENTYVKVNGAWQALVGSDVDNVANSGMFTGIEVPPPASLGSDGDYYYQRAIFERSIKNVNTAAIQYSNTQGYGTEFTVNQTVTVTHLLARFTSSRQMKLQIGTITEMLVETETLTAPGNEWIEVPLTSTIQLSPDTNYIVKAVTSVTPGNVAYVSSGSNLTYDSNFSYVGARFGTSWPGTSEANVYPLVGFVYVGSDGTYKIAKQFLKSSGTWSEI